MQKAIAPLLFLSFSFALITLSYSHLRIEKPEGLTEDMFLAKPTRISESDKSNYAAVKVNQKTTIPTPKDEVVNQGMINQAPSNSPSTVELEHPITHAAPVTQAPVPPPAPAVLAKVKHEEKTPSPNEVITKRSTAVCTQKEGFYINEIGQGNGGNQEWVELIAVGKNKLSLKGLAINNNSQGEGYVFFNVSDSRCSIYNDIPAGSLVIIFNEDEKDPRIPAADPYDSNKDGVYVIPGDNTCLAGCSSSALPCDSQNSPSYGKVNQLNEAKDVLTVYQNNQVFHRVAWGYNGKMKKAKTTDVGAGNARSYAFGAGSFTEGNNWTNHSSNKKSTPGAANNPNNANFIKVLKNKSFECESLEKATKNEA